MPFIEIRGIRFHYLISGSTGPTVVFQHGLGGDVSQPQSILGNFSGFRVLSFDCRGHGRTRPLGPPGDLRFSVFADDLQALLHSIGAEKVVVGGISMGAGVALNFALRYPAMVNGLILSRPAWLDRPHPSNLRIFPIVARLIREHGTPEARRLLPADPEFARIQSISRDNAASILRQLERPDSEATIETLSSLPADSPCASQEGWKVIAAPTLVLVNEFDAVHPLEYGEQLAKGISDARLLQIASKEKDPERHVSEARSAIVSFLAGLDSMH
jgi:pimeloyl-ACP methyl ester carboxylesterase